MSRRSKGTQKRKPSTLRNDAREEKLAATAPLETVPAWIWGLILVAATMMAYWRALHGNFVWDDDSWTTGIAPLLRDSSGLRAIWFNPIALQQYYPLAGTTFWLDYHLWGFSPLPYHVENVLLHACAVLLFWKLLTRLQVPGAWLAAGIFALHPVMVESAGWITERKNVLSLVLYLGALLAYGRFARFWLEDDPPAGPVIESPPPSPINHQLSICNSLPRRWGAWLLAFFLLLGALLAKTTAFSLPAVILLLCWWKRGRIRWRDDILPALPLFALALGLSLMTASLEKNHVGAQGLDWALSFPQRCLIAGRAFWFYLGKLAWPSGLCFVYPRWNPDPNSLAQWLYPSAAVGLLLGLWLARKRIGRGPATAAFFFVGTLFPVLGFMNAYFMRYSFVCDHWVYLSSLAPIALAAALVATAAAKFRAPAAPLVFALVVLPMLAWLTWRQCGMYRNMETLWRKTLARNPTCWMARANLGAFLLLDRNQPDEAISLIQAAHRLKPMDAGITENLGIALYKKGQIDEAISLFHEVVRLKPYDAEAHYHLGNDLYNHGVIDEAISEFREAIRLKPDFADAHNELGNALGRKGRMDEAMSQFLEAIRLKPDYAAAHNNLGTALAEKGRINEAISEFEEAIRLKPDFADALDNLANTSYAQGQIGEAIGQYREAVRLQPDNAEFHDNLANALFKYGQVDQSIGQYQEAIRLKPDSATAHFNLGTVLARNGRLDEAISEFQQAIRLDPDDASARDNLARALEMKQAPGKAPGGEGR